MGAGMLLSDAKDMMWLIGPALSLIGMPAAMWWLARGFATRAEFDAAKKRLDHAEERLDSGERRFNEMSASIREVTHAADEARNAAEKVMSAVGVITDMRISLERLSGEIRLCSALLTRVEKDANLLKEGHLSMGNGP
jgi:archaellum component FlaC